ncbi:hypothetical protein BCR35DRAFT_301302 [Leucosporidium creatinivorum]|uniref:Inhibitor I9 domain-containing protein n=1 Tax=Leucosporidium creatinivorum TaxID=106004 RepID=A0A1Y2FWY3_9BASI|nr:hypothetical protein BCR35DRAFT_301302 [Leucosporidium creatinivorum]
MKLLYPILTLLLVTFSLANPAVKPKGRVAVPFGLGADAAITEGKNAPIGGVEETANYLVTLSRTISNASKDKLLDVLMRQGAVVKQVFDYRVFKGVLFTVPSTSDRGLSSWQSALLKEDGVKIVEEDTIVKTN